MTGASQEPFRGTEYPALENWPGYPPPYPPAGYPSQPGYPPPGLAFGPYGAAPAPHGTNTNAIIAVVASALGVVLCGTSSIVGIILGVIAMRDTRRTGQDGHGLALAAVIIGALVVAFWLVYVVVMAALAIGGAALAP
jgi:hypothetical protein